MNLSADLAAFSKNWRYRLPLTFFGLSDGFIEGVYEQFFYLKYYGGWSFMEAYNLPIKIRHWFVHKLSTQMAKEKEAAENAKNKSKSR